MTTLNISLPEQAAKEKLDNMLLEGLASGETVEFTDEWWQEKQKRLRSLAKAQRYFSGRSRDRIMFRAKNIDLC